MSIKNDLLEDRSMRVKLISPYIFSLLLVFLLVGCNSDEPYANPVSPDAIPTIWHTGTVTPAGGTFDFADIGINIIFPAGAIPPAETFAFSVRGFPSDIPMVPLGSVMIRLGTFEMTGDGTVFLEPVAVRFLIAENRGQGTTSRGYRLNDSYYWQEYGNAPIMADGLHALLTINDPGIYGAFEAVGLRVEATVSQQMGTVPLSVGLRAVVTGGNPPYSALWFFGDDTDPESGINISHLYVNPGDYDATVTVTDSAGGTAIDWVHITCYSQSGPPAF